MSGYPDGTFKPNKQITRAEFAKVIVAAAGITPSDTEPLIFADADKIPNWARTYVATAYRMGVIKGYPGKDGRLYFMPDKNITRSEIGVMVVKAMGLESDAQNLMHMNLSFNDDQNIPDWSRGFIAVAYNHKILKGKGDGFYPNDNATRAESATMVVNMLNNGITSNQGGE